MFLQGVLARPGTRVKKTTAFPKDAPTAGASLAAISLHPLAAASWGSPQLQYPCLSSAQCARIISSSQKQ